MAKALLYPGADRSRWFGDKFDGRIFTDLDKLLLHSTETDKRWGCPGYSEGRVAPTLTVNPWPGYRKVWQHFNLNESARALMDPTTTAALENKDNVCQIEIVGYSDKGYGLARDCYLPNLDADSRQWLAGIFAFIMREWTIPNVWASPFPWPLYPASYGNTSSRMTSSEYERFTGVLGHLHASGNTHGDPSLPVVDLKARVGALLNPTTTTEEDELMAVTVKNPVTGKAWPIEDALWSMWTYILDGRNKAGEAARDAAIARALAEKSATEGRALTPEEIAAIGEAVGEKIAAGFDVELSPKAVQ